MVTMATRLNGTASNPRLVVRLAVLLASMALLSILTSTAFTSPTGRDATTKERIAQAKQIWERWIQDNVAIGDDLKKVDGLLKGSFRDYVQQSLGGTGNRRVTYLLDDYQELEFGVDRHDKLASLPAVLPARAWIRLPRGELLSSEEILRKE